MESCVGARGVPTRLRIPVSTSGKRDEIGQAILGVPSLLDAFLPLRGQAAPCCRKSGQRAEVGWSPQATAYGRSATVESVRWGHNS